MAFLWPEPCEETRAKKHYKTSFCLMGKQQQNNKKKKKNNNNNDNNNNNKNNNITRTKQPNTQQAKQAKQAKRTRKGPGKKRGHRQGLQERQRGGGRLPGQDGEGAGERKGDSIMRDERERGTDRTKGRREPEPSQNSGEDPKPEIIRGNYVELGITAILINSKN